MAKSNSEISDSNSFFGSITASAPFKNILAKSKQKVMPSRRSRLKSYMENIVPIHHNVQIQDPPLSASTSLSKKSSAQQQRNLLKEVSTAPVVQEQLPEVPDPPVKVVVRIKPGNGSSVCKVSNESVSVGGKRYKFDSVFDSKSTQGEIYELLGDPLVRDALSGYSTSVVAYGQTGSGKTYTMWGPPSAMVEGLSVSGNQGIVPRIFENLFSQIQKEQEGSDGKQINYQCRCSFLEVYNEKIGDLLDPTQREIEIRDDTKNGFYVDNATEEIVSSYEDVTQILIKGLSNRKIGATSTNSKSSRSHVMFTCIIESWCKDSSSKCFGSSKTSRINLVDLAGFDTKADDETADVKERKYIKKSTSQLGRLVNILAEGDQYEEVPYRNSRLTHLLRESFGGSAKLSIICTVSADSKNTGETLRTLQLGLRAKLMKNEPVVNEITEDDVNDLSYQIRQLKEELMRVKSSDCSNSLRSNQGYFGHGNVRESLNQLRLSLNRSLILPRLDNESDDELCINEDDVEDLRRQIEDISNSHEEHLKADSENGETTVLYSAEGDLTCEHYLSCSEESENEEINSGKTNTKREKTSEYSIADDSPLRNSLSILESLQSAILKDPVLSESPKFKNSLRKSLIFASKHLTNLEDAVNTSKNPDVLRQSHQSDNIKSSLRSSQIFPSPTESLAASLHRGLQIIDNHQRNSIALTRSFVSFSFEHLALKPCASADKANASVQTSQEHKSFDTQSGTFICMKCQGREIAASVEVEDSLKTWMVPVDGYVNPKGLRTHETKDLEKDLASAIEKEKGLASICKEQAAEIEQLYQQLKKYKCESLHTGCHNSLNSIEGKSQLEIINKDEHEHKLLTWNANEIHVPKFIRDECEIKEVQEEDSNRSMLKSFSLEEKEALLQEIEILRNKLKSYTDTPVRRSCDNLRSSLLSQSIQLRKSSAFSQANSKEEFEKEREKWMEMESEWISLTDELRIDIESNRQRAEQVEMELRLEKKCTEELDDALKRSVLGHARIVEHYADLQDKYNEMAVKHRAIIEGVAEVKRAASKAGAKGRHGSHFAKALVVELSALPVERKRERELLRKENRSLKIQLKDTAEAVHAAGEVLVRLREAEEATSVAESNNIVIQEENDKLMKQMEKLKRKHKMEMVTMKQYLAESRLPEAALRPPLFREESDVSLHHRYDNSTAFHDDDQAWRAEFGAIYQEQY